MENCKKKDAITEVRDEELERVTGGMRDPDIVLESSSKASPQRRRICKRCGSSISVNPDGYCSKCAKGMSK